MALRRQRLTGQQIARDLAVSPATVSRVLRRHGLSRIRDLEPPEPDPVPLALDGTFSATSLAHRSGRRTTKHARSQKP